MADGPRRRGGRGTERPSGPPRGRRPLDFRPRQPRDDAGDAWREARDEGAARGTDTPDRDAGPRPSRPPRRDRPDDDRRRGPRDDRGPRGDRPPRDRRPPRPAGGAGPRRRPRRDAPPDGQRWRPSRGGPPRERREPPPPDPAEVARKAARARSTRRLTEVDEVEITIEKLVQGGEGLGRFEGIPIFVPRSAPGDRLRVRLTERKSGYARGEIDAILEAGDGRREPPCPHFARCGGCDLQHLDESAQLRAKSEAVLETLRRLGGVEALPVAFEVVPGEPWGYRTRTQLHVERTDRGVEVGYFARGSHDLVPVDQCPVLVPELDAELRGLPRSLRDQESPPKRLDLAAGDDQAWTVSPPQPTLPQGEIVSTLRGVTYEWDARTFFQGHRQLASTLVHRALGDPDAIDPEAVAFDLYAGVGLFAVPLAGLYREVVAVEGDRVASRFARKNARRAGATNLQVETHMLDSWIEQLPTRPERVLVDPPRTGLSDRVRRTILARRPRWLTYVSCNPSTLARDLRELLRFYRLDALSLLDLFPQTGHMESVVQLVRIEDSA